MLYALSKLYRQLPMNDRDAYIEGAARVVGYIEQAEAMESENEENEVD